MGTGVALLLFALGLALAFCFSLLLLSALPLREARPIGGMVVMASVVVGLVAYFEIVGVPAAALAFIAGLLFWTGVFTIALSLLDPIPDWIPISEDDREKVSTAGDNGPESDG